MTFCHQLPHAQISTDLDFGGNTGIEARFWQYDSVHDIYVPFGGKERKRRQTIAIRVRDNQGKVGRAGWKTEYIVTCVQGPGNSL